MAPSNFVSLYLTCDSPMASAIMETATSLYGSYMNEVSPDFRKH